MASQTFHCEKVIAIDVEEKKLSLAKDFGATHVIHSKNIDPHKTILEITAGKGVDYAVDASGLCSVIEIAFTCVKNNGGLCVFASHPKAGEKIRLDPFDLICGKQIRGSWGGASQPDRDLPVLFELYRAGKLPLGKMLDRRYPLSEINQALEDLESRSVTRPLLEINPGLCPS
jgi:S-(hydroxymethyl)glutathione dehydrogenase/alcohol dehydrogenase